jgi:hypothetical protein
MAKRMSLILVLLTLISAVLYAQKQKSYQPNNAELQEEYENYNDWYFSGALPRNVPVSWDDIPMENGLYVMGRTYEDIAGTKFSIVIDTKTNITKSTTSLTLEHEMCHVATYDYVKEHGEDAHGQRFEACMTRLADEGAMQDLW